MAFEPRFQTVLRSHKRHCELQQQAVVSVRAHHANLIARRDLVAETRKSAMDRICELYVSEDIDVVQALNLQRHVDQMRHEMEILTSEIQDVSKDLQKRLEQLVEANRSVEAISRLTERETIEHRMQETRMAVRESDDLLNSSRR